MTWGGDTGRGQELGEPSCHSARCFAAENRADAPRSLQFVQCKSTNSAELLLRGDALLGAENDSLYPLLFLLHGLIPGTGSSSLGFCAARTRPFISLTGLQPVLPGDSYRRLKTQK